VKALSAANWLCFAVCLILPADARGPLAARIAHADPANYNHSPAVDNGLDAQDHIARFDFHSLDANLYFLHRGVIEPKSGIGPHYHNTCEEIFIIFDWKAQFTIDGRTSTLNGLPKPSPVPDTPTSSMQRACGPGN
jgi:hypothetical protein